MFVMLSKDLYLNLGLAASIQFHRTSAGMSAVLTYLDDSDATFYDSDARAIKLALVGRMCHVCGCTDQDCSQCIEAMGEPCHWVEEDLCSRCALDAEAKAS